LARIATEIVGPRLAALHRTDIASSLSFADLDTANALLVEDETPDSEAIAEAVLAMLESFFPETGAQQKLYLLNVLMPGGREFAHHQIGGRLDNDLLGNSDGDAIYPLEGSLTGLVIERFLRGADGADETVFVVNFDEAIKRGAMIPICKRGKTALACPIVFRDRVYGVIIVKSSHYDLDVLAHGKLLRLVAAEAAAMFARRECLCLQRLSRISNAASSIDQLHEWLAEMEHTYHCRSAERSFPATEVINVRETVAAAAQEALETARSELRSALPDGIPKMNLPDIEVSTYPATLATITYTVLRDIFTRHPAESAQLSIDANIQGREWLELSIAPYVSQSDMPTDQQLDVMDQCLRDTGTDGLVDTRALAHLHQFSGGRRGEVRTDLGNHLRVRLPVNVIKGRRRSAN
jgi:hypothetical protein